MFSDLLNLFFSVRKESETTTTTVKKKKKKKKGRRARDSSPLVNLSSRKSVVHFHPGETLVDEENGESEGEVCRAMLEKKVVRRSRPQPSDSRITRDRRAARSLFILVLVFLLFLFPYVICATLSTAGLSISSSLFEISFWLLWLNSTCNPFLYPFIQMKYRRAYLQLFRSSRARLLRH